MYAGATRAARRVGETAGPAERTLQGQAYPNQSGRSSLLVQAAEVLCLLTFSPLSAIERASLSALFQRRLERAYVGGRP
jgi:hypothetical protein